MEMLWIQRWFIAQNPMKQLRERRYPPCFLGKREKGKNYENK